MKFQVNHDLHCHSTLSSCCGDEKQTIQAIYNRAVRQGLETQCITDHLWDNAVPEPSNWYAPQDIDHVKKGKAELEVILAERSDGTGQMWRRSTSVVQTLFQTSFRRSRAMQSTSRRRSIKWLRLAQRHWLVAQISRSMQLHSSRLRRHSAV